jgi:hypothetical protein
MKFNNESESEEVCLLTFAFVVELRKTLTLSHFLKRSLDSIRSVRQLLDCVVAEQHRINQA